MMRIIATNGEQRLTGIFDSQNSERFWMHVDTGPYLSLRFAEGWSYEEVKKPKPLRPGWYSDTGFPVSPNSQFDPYFVDGAGDIYLMGRDGSKMSVLSEGRVLVPLVGKDNRGD